MVEPLFATAVEIPNWAISTFGVLFLLVVTLAVWGLKVMIARIGDDIKAVGKKVDNLNSHVITKIDDLNEKVQGIDKRLVVVETKMSPERTPAFGTTAISSAD